jgi:hypothetical protein
MLKSGKIMAMCLSSIIILSNGFCNGDAEFRRTMEVNIEAAARTVAEDARSILFSGEYVNHGTPNQIRAVKRLIINFFAEYFEQPITDSAGSESEIARRLVEHDKEINDLIMKELKDVLTGEQVCIEQEADPVTGEILRTPVVLPRLQLIYTEDRFKFDSWAIFTDKDEQGRNILDATNRGTRRIPYPLDRLPARIKITYCNTAQLFTALAHEYGHLISELITTLYDYHTDHDILIRTRRRGPLWRAHEKERISRYFEQLATQWLATHPIYWPDIGLNQEQVRLNLRRTRIAMLLTPLMELGIAKRYYGRRATFIVPPERMESSNNTVIKNVRFLAAAVDANREIIAGLVMGKDLSNPLDYIFSYSWNTSRWDEETLTAIRILMEWKGSPQGGLCDMMRQIGGEQLNYPMDQPQALTATGSRVPVDRISYEIGGDVSLGDVENGENPRLIVKTVRHHRDTAEPRAADYDNIVQNGERTDIMDFHLLSIYDAAGIAAFGISQEQMSNWDKVVKLIYEPTPRYNTDAMKEWLNYWLNIESTITAINPAHMEQWQGTIARGLVEDTPQMDEEGNPNLLTQRTADDTQWADGEIDPNTVAREPDDYTPQMDEESESDLGWPDESESDDGANPEDTE